jgi:SSS family solute:Na+ symporter
MGCRIALLLAAALAARAGDYPKAMEAFPGSTPSVDGLFTAGEWEDATAFSGVQGWVSTFSPVTDPRDLAVKGYVKHDGRRLYFGFDVTDDVLYGIDTPRWLPAENPRAHDLTRAGYPWFGDEMEILMNATNRWSSPEENAAGNGQSWQMVCNLTKSRLGGIGAAGLLEGEPRSSLAAWTTYQRWIQTHAMDCAAKPKPGGKGYTLEWAISFDPCLEVAPGQFYSPRLGDRPMGLNIALGDLDEKERGAGNFGNFHHEDWWTGTPQGRTRVKEWGTLWIRTANKKPGPR